LLTLFPTILLVCGKVNFTNLSRYSGLNEKSYRRHYLQGFDFTRINGLLIGQAIGAKAVQIAVMDSSFVSKSGKSTYGMDWFYNGSLGRSERGLEISVIAVIAPESHQRYSLSVKQTPAQLSKAKKPRVHQRISRRTIEELQALLEQQPQREGPQKNRGAKRKYDGKVDLKELSRFTHVQQLQPGLELYTHVVWHVSLKRLIRLACLVERRKLGKVGHALLFSTDLELDATRILSYYQSRFQIERCQAIHRPR
jgi:hypothetical protein